MGYRAKQINSQQDNLKLQKDIQGIAEHPKSSGKHKLK